MVKKLNIVGLLLNELCSKILNEKDAIPDEILEEITKYIIDNIVIKEDNIDIIIEPNPFNIDIDTGNITNSKKDRPYLMVNGSSNASKSIDKIIKSIDAEKDGYINLAFMRFVL
jgi:hypothetical protein